MRLLFPLALLCSATALAQQAPTDTLSIYDLEGVSITADRTSYKKEESSTVGKLPLRDLENPQVYNAISKEVLADQLVTDLDGALKNATGVARLWESTGRGGDGGEYYSLRGFSVQPTFVNGVASLTNGTLDPANVETVEVIKGPSGTLFGGSLISYGGLINVVTKQPYGRRGARFGYVTGSNNLNRLTADVNAPLSKTTFLRVNTAYQYANTFQDAGYARSFYVAPSLRVDANERLTFLVNAEFKQSEAANAPMLFLNRNGELSFDGIELFDRNYERSYTSNALTISNPTFTAQAQALYELSEHWTSQSIVSSSNTQSDGYYHYLYDAINGGDFTRYISRRNGRTDATNLQQNFIGDFRLGTVRNRLVVGVDYLRRGIQNNSTGWVANGTVNLAEQTDTGVLTPEGVDALLVGTTEGVTTATTEVFGAYVSDVIDVTPRLSAMLSLRLDNFSARPDYFDSGEREVKNQVTLSPKLGLVYQAVPERLSLFANYLNGFVNLSPVQVADADGTNPRIRLFDPERANQIEAGAKASLYQDKISLTASYYAITVSNKLMVDPENPNNQTQGGEVMSRGVELSVVTSPIEGLSVITGISYNDAEVTADAAAGGYLGLRPESAGPKTLFNFWANYRAPRGTLKGLGVGVGSNAAGAHLTLNRGGIGQFALPAYTLFNASVSYATEQYTLNLKVDNLTDRRYYTGWSTVTPQAPRRVSLGLFYTL